MDIFGINKKVSEGIAKAQFNNVSSLNAQQDLTRFMNSGGLATINPDNFDYENPFKTIGSVFETTDIICKKLISCPIVIYKVKDKKRLQESKDKFKSGDHVGAKILKQLAIEEVDAPDVQKLLKNPNKFQTGKQFLWTASLSYLLDGNSYIYGSMSERSKKPMELFPIPDMSIITNDSDMLDPIEGYKVNFGAGEIPFEKDEILHLKTGNPARYDLTYGYLYGVAPLRAYMEPLRTMSEAQKQATKQMKNGGVFGILSPKAKEDNFSSDQKRDLRDRMRRARMSNDELSRVFASSVTLQWQEMGLKSADLQLIEQLRISQKDVYRAYHVPFTYHDNDASSYNNVSTAVRQLVYDAVAPIADAISEGLTDFVGKPYGDYIIEIDYTQLPEMAINMKDISDYVVSLVEKGILTIDEARVALGYGELDTDESKALFYNGKKLNLNNE